MAGVNVKMGVSGVQQFKQAMSESAAAAKTLDAQMRLTETQFKATGDAETYLSNKGKILKTQIENQRNTIRQAQQAMQAMLNQGINPANKAYQDMQTRMTNAQTAMVRMEADLKGLGGTAEETAQKTQGLGTAMEGISRKISLEQISSGIKSVTGAMEAAARKAADFGTALWDAMVKSAAWADDLNTRASILGLDTQTLQRMDYAAKIVDTSAETIVGAQRKLSINMQGMGTSYHEVYQVFKDIGSQLDVFNIQRILQDNSSTMADKFWKIGEAIHKMTDEEKQNALAQRLFGKSWSELNPAFSMTPEEVERYGTAYARYKAIMNDPQAVFVEEKQTKNLSELSETIDRLEQNFTAIKSNMLGELAPAFTEVSDKIAGMMAEFNKWLQTPEGQEKMTELGDSLKGLFDSLTDVDFSNVTDIAVGAINGLTEALTWLKENGETVKSVIEGIAIAWASLKVAEGVTDVLKVIDGLKGLVGTGAAEAATGGATAGASWGKAFAKAAKTALPNAVAAYLGWEVVKAAPVDAGEKAAEALGLKVTTMEKRMNEMMKKNGILTIGDATKITEQLPQETKQKAMRSMFGALIGTNNGGVMEQAAEDLMTGLQKKLDEFDKFGQNRPKTTIDAIVNMEKTQEQLNQAALTVPVVPVINWTANESWAWRVGSGGYIRNVPGGIGTGAVMPSMRANGLPYVPYDGYPAILHKGERVMTARENTYNNSSNLYVEKMVMNNGLDAQALVSAMDAQARRTRRGYGN